MFFYLYMHIYKSHSFYMKWRRPSEKRTLQRVYTIPSKRFYIHTRQMSRSFRLFACVSSTGQQTNWCFYEGFCIFAMVAFSANRATKLNVEISVELSISCVAYSLVFCRTNKPLFNLFRVNY